MRMENKKKMTNYYELQPKSEFPVLDHAGGKRSSKKNWGKKTKETQ
jgi:hypothetical protein